MKLHKTYFFLKRIGFITALRLSLLTSSTASFSTRSPVTNHILYNKLLHIKRDDQLILHGVTGNKVRKFQKLVQQLSEYDSSTSLVLGSYGGVQSNSMAAISQIASMFPFVRFLYFCKPIPQHLKNNPVGNYADLLSQSKNQLIEVSIEDYKKLAELPKMSSSFPEWLIPSGVTDPFGVKYVWIPQGGAMYEASYGATSLAEELEDYILSYDSKLPWQIIFASGTGTLAMFVHQAIKSRNHIQNVDIVAIPCVSNAYDLKEEMIQLDHSAGHYQQFPIILDDNHNQMKRNRIFAKPYKDHYDIWQYLKRSTEIEFDLIYAPRAFEILLPYIQERSDMNFIYYHCGGTEGNLSQLKRYQYAKIIS